MTFRSFFKKIRFTNFFRPYFAFHSFNKLRMKHPVFPFFTAVYYIIIQTSKQYFFWDQGPNSAGSQFFSNEVQHGLPVGESPFQPPPPSVRRHRPARPQGAGSGIRRDRHPSDPPSAQGTTGRSVRMAVGRMAGPRDYNLFPSTKSNHFGKRMHLLS